MNIAFYVNDLNEYNGHLMPWRTILEVAASLHAKGHQSVVLSGVDNPRDDAWNAGGGHVRFVGKPYKDSSLETLKSVCREEAIEILYWPLDWRNPRIEMLSLESTGLQIVWYVPGAWYGFKQVLIAAAYMRSKAVLPYFIQAASSKRHFVNKLTGPRTRPLITMTDFTRSKLIESGYPATELIAIPPGKASLPVNDGQAAMFNALKNAIGESPYFLFFGPPQAIRGVDQIFKAFKKVSKKHLSAHLICLFRSDKETNLKVWQKKVKQLECKQRITCVWESVTAADLDAFISHSHAVLKPFLLVPSEIPLAVIETAGYGKPVIGTGPDGTGAFVSRFGLTVPFGQSVALADAMLELLVNEKLYVEKCKAAAQVYENHPTWEEVAQQWLDVVN